MAPLIPKAAVQEVIAECIFHHCQRAAAVPNSQFTPGARPLAKKDQAIELIDRSALGLLVPRDAERPRKP